MRTSELSKKLCEYGGRIPALTWYCVGCYLFDTFIVALVRIFTCPDCCGMYGSRLPCQDNRTITFEQKEKGKENRNTGRGGGTERRDELKNKWGGKREQQQQQQESRVTWNTLLSDQNPMMYNLISGWRNTIHNSWVTYICWKLRLMDSSSYRTSLYWVIFSMVHAHFAHSFSHITIFGWNLDNSMSAFQEIPYMEIRCDFHMK